MIKKFNKAIGTIGESRACQYLKNRKYKILMQNYKNKIGEIDIIARQKKTIVFIEVKTRQTLAFGRPSEAVNLIKQQKIRNTAMCYLIQNCLNESPVRFDVIEVIGENEINHIENAF